MRLADGQEWWMQDAQALNGDCRIAENEHALIELFGIVSGHQPLEQMLASCLDRLLSLSWLSLLPKAGIFLTGKGVNGASVLQLVAERNLGEEVRQRCGTVRFGECLCGRAAQTGEPIHAACIDTAHEIIYPGMQPHGHYNIPILAEGQVLGVLVFYLPHGTARDEAQFAFLCRCAGVLSMAIELRSKEQQLKAMNRELMFQKETLDHHAIVSVADVNGNITYANRKFCDISGYSQAELLGQNHRILKSDEHANAFYDDMWQTITSGQVWHGEIKNKKRNGDHYWVSATIVPCLNEQGEPFQYIAIRTDITERKSIESALQQAQKIAGIGSWSLDLLTDKLLWSDEIYNIFGMPVDQFRASFSAFLDAVHPDDLEYVKEQYQGSLEGRFPYNIEHRIVRRDTGEVRWVHEMCAHQYSADGQVIRSDGTVQDITGRKEAQDAIHRLAMTDQLTGLANRNQFHQRFEEALKLAKREHKELALILLDLDMFKPVNDLYGHQVGDKVLKAVAGLFTRYSRETDVVARFGGDEFAVLLVHPDSRSSAQQYAQRIIEKIIEPIIIDAHEIRIGTSIGIATYPADAAGADELILYADKALYEAKRQGRNTYCMFRPSLLNP
ncbi:diguanylate cyclase [Mariprofundus erugo]|uniref:Diguanylate cyclase n=2 Tax=Mariprofundus erugo TaxID=2528639 RepID=A0A5R9GMW2_9PROT|nr:diguanylate cyclase [Mariprofundus erugo]TLS65627.1 diguanylate cyclase [Mariprofundus erugo]